MRKCIISSVLLLCLFLSACSPNSSSSNNPNNENFNLIGQACTKSFTTLEEYESFIVTWSKYLPQNFVTWDSLSHLAEFYIFDPLIYFDEYNYIIKEGDGYVFNLYIDHSPELENTTAARIYTDIGSLTNMYEINWDDRSVIIKRGIYEYQYAYGTLGAIVWYSNGIKFSLECDFSKYLNNDASATFVGRLLSTDESVANAAFAEITKKLSK